MVDFGESTMHEITEEQARLTMNDYAIRRRIGSGTDGNFVNYEFDYFVIIHVKDVNQWFMVGTPGGKK